MLLSLSVCLLPFATSRADVHYVSLDGNHVPPFTNWVDAARTIQAAVDSAGHSDTVVVSNGVYAVDGRVVHGDVTNRVAIDRAITVRSLNGKEVTTIVGVGPLGDRAVRCAYVGTNAVLLGFTLTNGCTRSRGDRVFERSGGGAWCEDSGMIRDCRIVGSVASWNGGGVHGGSLSNCVLVRNATDRFQGGGAFGSDLQDCALDGNSSRSYGGGAGTNAVMCAADIDGETWRHPPSTGCDELVPGAEMSVAAVACHAFYTQVVAGLDVDFVAAIDGVPAGSVWEFGDGISVSNRPYVSHAWDATGAYDVVLTAWDDVRPFGLSATVTLHIVEEVTAYVRAGNPSASHPYDSWATAAANIQDAVDACPPGGVVVVSNGVYASGGSGTAGATSNRVVIVKPLCVRSVNGPAATRITGVMGDGVYREGAMRCAYVGDQAELRGFTLTGGDTVTCATPARLRNAGWWATLRMRQSS